MAKHPKSLSKFDGGFFGYLGISILAFLLSVCTLFIGTPWAVCMVYRWYIRHTALDGARLYFDGTGLQLWGNIIKWLLLTVITVGIFALWMPFRFMNWVAKHTHHVAPSDI